VSAHTDTTNLYYYTVIASDLQSNFRRRSHFGKYGCGNSDK